jgi:periodic tryptophan protein 1
MGSVDEDEGSEDDEDAESADEDMDGVTDAVDSMDVDGDMPKTKPRVKASSDPNDMSAFKMDEYDEEESGGVGELMSPRI